MGYRDGYILGGKVAFAQKAERVLQFKPPALMPNSREEWKLMPLQASM